MPDPNAARENEMQDMNIYFLGALTLIICITLWVRT
jgi:hypothetical protein